MIKSKSTQTASKRASTPPAPIAKLPSAVKPATVKQIAKAPVTIKNTTPPDRRNESLSITDRLIRLLQAPKGATMAQMQEATGWQPHSVRGTLSTVLRKKRGLNVSCTLHAPSGERRYRIDHPASETK